MSRPPPHLRRALRAGLAAGLGLLAAGLALGGCSRGTEPRYRHVVLLSLDTVRADHLGCLGSTRTRTPRLDALAAGGTVFTQAMTAAPTTAASHTSIFTGKYPQAHGVARNGFTIHPDNRLLAQILREAGYRTIAVLGSFALDRRFGFDRGFERFDDRFDLGVGDGRDQEQRRGDRVTDAALAAVDRVPGEPLFLFVHYFDAHAPYEPPPPFDAAARAIETPPAPPGFGPLRAAVAAQQVRILGHELGLAHVIQNGLPRELVLGADGAFGPHDEHLAALYAGEIEFMDREIGRLLDGLAQRGILEDALVVVVADHGESFAEHADSWNHGLCVYETTAHVPWILRVPGARHPREVSVPVSTVDVLPTVLDLLGVDPGADARLAWDGVSLAPLLAGEPFERGPIFCQATQPPTVESGQSWANARKARAMRAGDCKLIETPYLDLMELYDLGADRGERSDLLRQDSPASRCAVRELARTLEAWAASADPLPSAFDRSQLEETIRKLRGLGYADAGVESAPHDEASPRPPDEQ